jgi:hypothetical protein
VPRLDCRSKQRSSTEEKEESIITIRRRGKCNESKWNKQKMETNPITTTT